MCNEACWYFKGWWKSFTFKEKVLTIVETFLLAGLIVSLVIFVLHFINCLWSENNSTQKRSDSSTTARTVLDNATDYNTFTDMQETETDPWTGDTATPTASAIPTAGDEYFPAVDFDIPPDGKTLGTDYTGFLAAFVKIYPEMQTLVFGCPLTLITYQWTITAATCIEAIEEMESLHNYVIMPDYDKGNVNGKTYPVVSILFHPRYQGYNKTYDVAALKAYTKLVPIDRFAHLPTMFEYLSLSMGQRLIVLGYGRFRTKPDTFPRSIRKAGIYVMPSVECPPLNEDYEELSLRHLSLHQDNNLQLKSLPKKELPDANYNTICGGVRRTPYSPCYFCTGTPIFSGQYLVGIMSENENCGTSCEPSHFVNVAIIVDWLKLVTKL